ncbi:MAG: geranylgeranyl reductase family protein [Bacteroidales bacterium]|nr:geranylgeranyl reductase family protein [Bacteroidales bacterium]
MQYDFDVIISGGGPAGAACAIALKDSGLRVGLFDKDIFPRDKTCGDGLTPDTINQLALLDPSLSNDFKKMNGILLVKGVKLNSHNGKNVTVPLLQETKKGGMYSASRYIFDDLLFRFAASQPNISAFAGTPILSTAVHSDRAEVQTSKGIFSCKILIGADGENSPIARLNLQRQIGDNEKYIAIRAYYQDVKLPDGANYFHYFFPRNTLPIGIWIFPEADGNYNVGIGMSISLMKKRNANLAQLLQKEIEDGMLTPYFSDAKAVSPIKGHTITVGRKGRPISSNRLLLLGDAAGLANPLTGEGITNAIRSGRVAALHLQNCFSQNRFDADFNKAYDKEIYRRMAKEFNNYRFMEAINTSSFLNNYIIEKVAPHFTSFFSNPDVVNSIQNSKFFAAKILRYMIFKR